MDIHGIPWNYFHGVFGRNFLANPCKSVKSGGKTVEMKLCKKKNNTAFYGNVPPNSIILRGIHRFHGTERILRISTDSMESRGISIYSVEYSDGIYRKIPRKAMVFQRKPRISTENPS